jgi:hypothetical protein
MSLYESKIVSLLNKEAIFYEREKTFWNKWKKKYRFDFYIPSMNIAIEVQGEQHYVEVRHFYPTHKDFLAAQERDRRKIAFCLANDIALYIIPYWDIDKINSCVDIFQPQYRARSKWHNDNTYRIHLQSLKNI